MVWYGYFNGYDDGITNGWAWYEIDGGRQDYMNYYEHCREMTLELTNGQIIPEDELADYWEYNRAALVNYIEEVLYGVSGTVTNSQGEAIDAIITIPDHDFDNSHALTHSDSGIYYRLLAPGTYNIQFESYSYETHSENNIVLGQHESVNLDIVLNPLPPLSFTGVVLDAEDGLPIENALVEILDIPLEAIYSDEGGEFMLTPVYAGTYLLHIFADDFGVFLEEIEITEEMEDLQITLIHLSVVDFEAGSIPDGWEVSGNADWQITNDTAANGLFSLQSGDISNDQISTVSISMDVPLDGEISFFCKVACEDDSNNNWDYLYFAIDGIELERWDGQVDWHEEVYPVSAGMHTFTWTYSKDGSVSHYADAGWIDYIDLPDDTDVSEIIPGDVSLDGVVDILDVVMTVNFILNVDEPSNEAQIAGDLDENGVINVLDLIGIVNIILSS